ncbi:MAG: glycosyltransferase family 4 protein [Pyrobaculum sp.]
MKIAYIYDAVYPWVKGGGEKRVYELARRLAARGHEVHWFGLKWWDGPRHIEWNGVHLHGVGTWDTLYVKGRRSVGEAIYFAIKTLLKLGGKFDVVDSQQFPYLHNFAAKLRRLDFIITWHEVWGRYWLRYLGRPGLFGMLAERLATRLTRRHVAVSKRTARELEKMGVYARMIPNGVDVEKIEKIKPSPEESDVIYVGRLVREKRVDLLLKAARLLKKWIPDLRVVVIGDGPERPRLEKLARGLDVKFTGFLQYEEVIARMKSSKVFVLPSEREGFGIAVLEANAAGLPAVVVRHEMNAAVDLIEEGKNGYVAEPNEADLAEKIHRAMGHMRQTSVEYAKMYHWDKITDAVEAYYRGL